jgi:hypothetical protein
MEVGQEVGQGGFGNRAISLMGYAISLISLYVRTADIRFLGGGPPASSMREEAGELKRILSDKAPWPRAWGEGSEAVFREPGGRQ